MPNPFAGPEQTKKPRNPFAEERSRNPFAQEKPRNPFGEPTPEVRATERSIDEDARRVNRALRIMPHPSKIGEIQRKANDLLTDVTDPRVQQMNQRLERQVQAAQGVETAKNMVNQFAEQTGRPPLATAEYDPTRDEGNAAWIIRHLDLPDRTFRAGLVDLISDDPEAGFDIGKVYRNQQGTGQSFVESVPAAKKVAQAVAPVVGRRFRDPMDRKVGVFEPPDLTEEEKQQSGEDFVGGLFEVATSPTTYLGFGGMSRAAVKKNVSGAVKKAGKTADEAARIGERAARLYGRKGGTVEFKKLMDDLLRKEKALDPRVTSKLGENYRLIDREGFTAGVPFTSKRVNLGGGQAVRQALAPIEKATRKIPFRHSIERDAGVAGDRAVDFHAAQEVQQRVRGADHTAEQIRSEGVRRWQEIEKKLPTDPARREEIVRHVIDPDVKVETPTIPASVYRAVNEGEDFGQALQAWLDKKAATTRKDGRRLADIRITENDGAEPTIKLLFTKKKDVSLTPAEAEAVTDIQGFYEWLGEKRTNLGLDTTANPLSGMMIPRVMRSGKNNPERTWKNWFKGNDPEEDFFASTHGPNQSRARNVNKQSPLGNPANDEAVARGLIDVEFDPGKITAAALGPQARFLARTEVRQWLGNQFGLTLDQIKENIPQVRRAFVEKNFDQVRLPTGETRFVPTDLTSQLQKTWADQRWVRGLDKAMNLFRASKLAASPSYHSLNLASDLAIMWADGFRNFGLLPKSVRVWKGADERLGTIAGRPYTTNNARRELNQFGVGRLDNTGQIDLTEVPSSKKTAQSFEQVNQGKIGDVPDRPMWARILAPGAEYGSKVAGFQDRTLKTAMFIHHRLNGIPPRLAWRRVTEALPDYGATDPTLRVARRVFSFPTWQIRSLANLPKIMSRSPGTALNLERANIFQSEGGYAPADFQEDQATVQAMSPLATDALMAGSPQEKLPTQTLVNRFRQPFTEGLAGPAGLARGALDPDVSLAEGVHPYILQTNPFIQMGIETASGLDLLTKRPAQMDWDPRHAHRVFPSGTFSDPSMSRFERDPDTYNAYMRWLPSLFASPPVMLGAEVGLQNLTGAPADIVGRRLNRAPDAATRNYLRFINMMTPLSLTLTDPASQHQQQTWDPDVRWSGSYPSKVGARAKSAKQRE